VLLVSEVGSGRRQLVKLASLLCKHQFEELLRSKAIGGEAYKDWMKVVLRVAGVEQRQVVLLLRNGELDIDSYL